MAENKKDLQLEDRMFEFFRYYRAVFSEDVRFKIVDLLASREGANLREIARRVGISHTNCSRYLGTLVNKGVVDVYPVGQGRNVYRLSAKYALLRQFHNNNHNNGNHTYNNSINTSINSRNHK